MDILLTHQIQQYRAGEEPDKLVALKNLKPPLRESLRVGMRAVKRFQDRVQDEIGTVILPF